MKTNGDEKETHLAETTATYALGVFCQLVNPYISGVDHHKKGFMKDFFDAVLEDDGLRNPLPQHHRNRKPGKTTITTGVWSGINDTDLTRFYNGRKKIPAWKAAEFYQRLDISKVERLCCDISIDALADFQKELIKANIRVTDISELPSATGKWLLSILQANAGGRDILIDGISFQPKFDIFENLPLASGRINNGKLHLGRSSVPWKAYPIPPDKPDDHLEKTYLTQMQAAYADHLHKPINCSDDLPQTCRPEYAKQREYFYDAEGMRRNLRDVQHTTQETATRLTLCIPLLSRPSTIDEITAIDLIATYMKTFGFGQRNLHGDGPHALAEYDARRKRIQAGLAQLVIVGAATVDSTCLLYRATPECFQYSEALHGDYAASYRQAVQLLIKNDYETIMNRITKENNQL